MSFVRRFAALALAFGLMAGDATICAGWMATPEARMACCADDAGCPMNVGDAHGAGHHRLPTQAEADGCCAVSGSNNSRQSGQTLFSTITTTVLGAGVVRPPDIPALVRSDAWRTSAPMPSPPVPRHLLLSVFLV